MVDNISQMLKPLKELAETMSRLENESFLTKAAQELSAVDVKELARRSIIQAFTDVDEEDLTSIKLYATGLLTGLLEQYDSFLPAVGAFVDLPVVDKLQANLVGAAIDKAFNMVILEDGQSE